MAQCTLSGTYNASNFQTAVTNAVNNGCAVITLTGNVSYAGNSNVIIPTSASLVIGPGGSVTLSGTASLTTTNNIEILSGGSFATAGNADVTFVNSPLPNQIVTPGLVNGPITITRLGPLPVELSSFNAFARAGAIEISWSTASELNNERFLIERSGADAVFVSIGEVKGAGTTAEPTEYSFTDRAPLQGANYYRLRQIDHDGTENLSKVVTASLNKPNKLKAFPNPVSNVLNIESNQTGDFYILNLLGQQVLRGKIRQQIDVSALPQGTYILKIGLEQVKFVKQ